MGIRRRLGPARLAARVVGPVGLTVALLATGLGAQGPSGGRAIDSRLAGLDEQIRRTMEDWEVPGVAVGIVRGDTVLFSAGFGVREVGHPEPVDTRTVFGNGSTTKAFTAALLGVLVDEGLLGWDDRVADRLPGFQLYDAYATREATVRDLLAHRTGVTAGTYQLLQYWGSRTPRDELVRRLRFEPRAASFRSRHIYHNITYTAAGSVAEAVTGRSWEALLREKVLDPLGMRSSTPYVAEVLRGTNVAMPHAKSGGRIVPVQWLDLENIGPAGSLSSTVEDMMQWLRMLAAGGTLDGRRVLSAESVREMFTPAIPIAATSLADRRFASYGLGWQVGIAHGRLVAVHTGSAQGFRAMMAVVPAERIGVVIFSNRHVSQYPVAVLRNILDRLLGSGETPDRSAELLAEVAAASARQEAAEAKLEAARQRGSGPSLPLEQYTGTYRIDLLDPSEVRVEAGGLVWEVSPAFVGELEHWHHDVFRVVRWRMPIWEGYAGMYPFIRFGIGPTGAVEMRVDGVGTLMRSQP